MLNRMMGLGLVLLLPGIAAAAAPPVGAAAPSDPRLPEAAEMFLTIVAGQPIGPGGGWFHPSKSMYNWKWLRAKMDADRDGAVTRKEFRGPAELFDRLDRDGDGRITAADFDWSPRSALAQQAGLAGMLFRRADKNANGRISAAEWQALFKEATGGKDDLTPEDLRRLLFPPQPRRSDSAKGPPPGSGMPSRWVLLRGLFNGEIGSLHEGPDLGAPAPGFRLKTHDGKRTIALSDYRGKKPVVLIFGSFT
jgi:hypothetical protein